MKRPVEKPAKVADMCPGCGKPYLWESLDSLGHVMDRGENVEIREHSCGKKIYRLVDSPESREMG